MSKKLSIGEFLEAFNIAKEIHANGKEPIPELGPESPEKINYILEVPFQEVFGRKLYYGFYDKAAVLLYLIIKNHPLANGNKRMALLTLYLFYDKNKRALNAGPEQIYQLVMFIVNSPSTAFKRTLKQIKATLKSYEEKAS